MERLADNLASITSSLAFFTTEALLAGGIVAVLLAGLFRWPARVLAIIAAVFIGAALTHSCLHFSSANPAPVYLFAGMLRHDLFGSYMKVLFDVSALLCVWMTSRNGQLTVRVSEYYTVLLGTLLGAHLLAMAVNLVMVFISLELISLGSYVLAGYAFTRQGAEGSFKYFVFGSVASAIMLYGFSILYGLTGTLAFDTPAFVSGIAASGSALMYVSSLMALSGFFYKIAAVPMHPWSPDVYEAAPMPVVAYFSVVPKLAGLAVLIRFTQVMPAPDANALWNWQNLLAVVAMASVTMGNFSALWQREPKRLMAYSSIAQAGFLFVGIVAIGTGGLAFALFYAAIYLLANFLVFIYLQYYEAMGVTSLESFSGVGRSSLVPAVFLLVALVTLTGLPPTAGFTAKLFVFSALWDAYATSGKSILLWLLVFGLLNTVVSLFYYIRIPYFSFVRPGSRKLETNFLSVENLFGLVLVLLVLGLFFNPGMLMGWINKINFAL